MPRMRFDCRAGTSGLMLAGKKTSATPIIATATVIITALTARSLNATSNTTVNSVIPQPRATVYSHRLPSGGRSVAMPRETIETVSKARAQPAAPVAKDPIERGTETRTGTTTVMALVAA